MASSREALTGVLHDIRYGIRQMRRAPALAAIVVLSLALGIGANTAIFSVVNAMALRDLPVTDPARLMVLQYLEPKGDTPAALEHSHSGRNSQDSEGRTVGRSVSWPMFTYLRERTRTIAPLVGFVPLGMLNKPAAVVNGEPMFVDGDMVTADYFPVVGVAAIRGRVIGPDDERPDAPRVGVISERFWERAYARNPGAIGNTMTLNGVPVTVVGVLPASFTGLETGRSPDLWVPDGPPTGTDAVGRPAGGRSPGGLRLARLVVAAGGWPSEAGRHPRTGARGDRPALPGERAGEHQFHAACRQDADRPARSGVPGLAVYGVQPPLHDVVERPDGGGRAGVPDCLCECGDAAARAGHGSAKGDESAAGDGRAAVTPGAPVADRERGVCSGRRRAGAPVRDLGWPDPARAVGPRTRSAASRRQARLPGPRLHRWPSRFSRRCCADWPRRFAQPGWMSRRTSRRTRRLRVARSAPAACAAASSWSPHRWPCRCRWSSAPACLSAR